ncbi:MAG: Clp protease N-terminal domain-containing protein, partial [Solirubrobacteraceae bacterium]
MTKHSRPAGASNPWSTYIDAREEARRRGDRKVGTEHLILGLLSEPLLAQA